MTLSPPASPLIVDFLSRSVLSAVDGTPVTTAAQLVDWLRSRLNLDDAVDASCFASFSSIGGYSGATGLPRGRETVIDAGSCVVFDVPTSRVARAAELASLGVGHRLSEGFGEIDVSGNAHVQFTEGAADDRR